MSNIFQNLPMWKTETEVNVDTSRIYPATNESIDGSPYLTAEREALIVRGNAQIKEVTMQYLERINRVMALPNILALVLWIAASALTVWSVTESVSHSQGTFLGVLTCGGLIFLALYCARAIVTAFRGLCRLLVRSKLEAEAQVHKEDLKEIRDRLKTEMNSIENVYFEKVMDAQFKYGSNNTGIAMLADWCCERMMKVLELTDKRQFLEKIQAGMSFTVRPDHVPVQPRPQVEPGNYTLISKINNPDPKEWTFYFREHSIYDIPNDVYSLVGCAQALATHIQEKLPEHMSAAGYDPLMVVNVSGRDNAIKLDLTVQNPQFVPFVEM